MTVAQETAREEKGMGLATVARTGELASTAAAAQSKATIEAAYIIALNRPRNVDDARAAILKACKRPRFAEAARYSKPVGGQAIVGPSIRFAEQAIQAYGNIRVASSVIHEDNNIRVLHVSVTDLETNISYGQDVTLQKTVERSRVRPGQIVISQRTNSNNQTTYIVQATEDELANKVAAAQSKIIRNSGLRLIPKDIIEEAMELCEKTLSEGGEDPDAMRKKIVDSFAELGIKAAELEAYLGRPLAQVTPKDRTQLAMIYRTIRDGEAKWSDYQTESTGELPPVGSGKASENLAAKLKSRKAEGSASEGNPAGSSRSSGSEVAQGSATAAKAAESAGAAPAPETDPKADLVNALTDLTRVKTLSFAQVEEARAMLGEERFAEALKDAKLTEKDIPGLKAPAIKTLLLECISVVKG